MPNHVRNILTITGNESELNRFKNLMCSDTNPALKEHYEKCLKAQIEMYKKKIKEKNHWAQGDLKRVEQELASLDKFQTIFSFDATVPQPPELNGTTSPCPKEGFEVELQKEYREKFGAGNWYDWHQKFIGTKWGAYDVSDEWRDVENGIGIDFDTAWSPPDTWLTKTAEMFPSLTFTDCWHSEGGETGRLIICVDEGIYDSEPLEEHDWLIENDGMYADEYHMVTQEDYKQAVKDVLESNESFGWYQNEKKFLERLKPEDMPLFINFEWLDKDAFEQKMKEVL